MDSYIGFYTLTLYKNCIPDFYRMYIYNEKQVLRYIYIPLHAKIAFINFKNCLLLVYYEFYFYI